MEDGSTPPDRCIIPAQVLQPDADVSALGTQVKCVDVYKQVGLDGSGSRQNNADGLYCLGISNDVSMLIYYCCTDY